MSAATGAPILCGHAGSPERARRLAEEHEDVLWSPETGDTIVVISGEGFVRLMGGHGAWASWDETTVRPDGGEEIVLRPIAPEVVI